MVSHSALKPTTVQNVADEDIVRSACTAREPMLQDVEQGEAHAAQKRCPRFPVRLRLSEW